MRVLPTNPNTGCKPPDTVKKPFFADSDCNLWMLIDYDGLRHNLQQLQCEILDLSLPVFANIWQTLQADALRIGIWGVTARNPRLLAATASDFKRILLPGFPPGSEGYAEAGIIPVLSCFSQILALSNQAQYLGRRCQFMLQVKTDFPGISSEETGFNEILTRLESLAMIDPAGAFFDFNADERLIQTYRRQLKSFNPAPIILAEESSASGCTSISSWEPLGIGKEALATPLSIGFRAFPVSKCNGEIIYRLEAGLAHGLPRNFPAFIGQRTARVLDSTLQFSLLATTDEGQEAAKIEFGFLLGGTLSSSLSPHSWDLLDLKNFLQHCSEVPAYIEKADSISKSGLNFI